MDTVLYGFWIILSILLVPYTLIGMGLISRVENIRHVHGGLSGPVLAPARMAKWYRLIVPQMLWLWFVWFWYMGSPRLQPDQVVLTVVTSGMLGWQWRQMRENWLRERQEEQEQKAWEQAGRTYAS